jgi:signal transduction histidine kinase
LNKLLRDVNELTTESLTGVDRISTIVKSLKGMARQRPDEKVSFDPARAVNEAVMFFRGAKQRRDVVICEISAMPPLIGEPGALGQVILNLLDNALDAMGGQGTVRVLGSSDGSRVCVKVIDEGPGIPPEIQPQLFAPFFTTKGVGKGTGLGLYISHEIVRRLGGTLRFETGPSGTTFIVEIAY